MSIPTAPEYAPAQPQYQPQEPKKKFNWKLAVMIFAAVLIGGFVGSAVKPPVVEVQEKIVEKAVTPAPCLKALDLNEEAFGYLSDSLSQTLDKDYTAANRYLDKVTALVPKVNAAKSECRAK